VPLADILSRTRAARDAGALPVFAEHVRAAPAPPAKEPIAVAVARTKICGHLGAEIKRICGGATLHPCGLFGGTTSRPGACTEAPRNCGACDDHTALVALRARALPVLDAPPVPAADRFPPVGRRHLVYHLLPVSGNGVWRRAVDALRLRWPLFTGRKVVAIATGAPVTERVDKSEGMGPQPRTLPLDPAPAVRAYLPADCEVVEVANDPSRWEGVSWPLLWETVLAGIDSLDAVLYAHAKGVSRRPGSPCHRWADLLYSLSLDHWSETEAVLRRYPIAGSLVKRGKFFGAPSDRSQWHYSGNFWWGRAGDLRAAVASTPVPVDRWGAEAWPGIAFPLAEAGEVFGPKPAADFHLYDPAHLDRVLADHSEWLAAHPPSRPVAPPGFAATAGGVRLSVIVATTGRASIARTLESITSQLLAGDEVIVRPDRSGDWGATPRTAGARQATGDYLLWMDDDDLYLPGAFAAIRSALRQNPGRPHLFKLWRAGPGADDFSDELPRAPVVKVGENSTQMFVVPNDPARIGTWGTRYEGDFDFIASTLSLYPPNSVVFRPEIIAVWRPHPDGVWSPHPWPKWWSYERGSWDEAAFLETVSRDDYRAKMIPLVGATVVDVGAHVGSFAYLAKSRGASVVHCYEPEPVALGHLRENAKHLRGVSVFAEGVGELLHDMAQAGRVLPRAAPTIDLDAAILRAAADSPRRRVDLLKIDCEGGEWPALTGFTRWDLLDAVVGEWHEIEWTGRTRGPDTLREIFAAHGWGVECVPQPELIGGRGLFFAAPK